VTPSDSRGLNHKLSGDYRTARHLGLAVDPAVWLPLPYLPAAMVLVAAGAIRLVDRWAWAATGVTFGTCAAAIWGAPLLLALGAGPALVGGAAAWRWGWRTLEAPSPRPVAMLVALLAGALPLLCGAVELYLRTHTP
jgi:hypothetical protein